MAMQQRERLLALGLGIFVALVVAYWAFGKYRAMFTSREGILANRRDAVFKEETKKKAIDRATARRRELEKRSLPKDALIAETLYLNFLVDLAKGKLTETSIGPQQLPGGRGKGHRVLGFHVKGKGSLADIARLLFDFYSTNHLHQISSFSIKPQEKSSTLDLDMHIEAVILPGTSREDSLTTEKGDNLALESFDEYQKAITGRNLFVEYTPPPPPTKFFEPPKENFDKAKLAFLTSIVEVNGRPQAWLYDRLASKQTALYEGDSFDVAGIKGTVKRIDFDGYFVELEIDGKPVKISRSKSLGETLADATKSD